MSRAAFQLAHTLNTLECLFSDTVGDSKLLG